MDAPNKIWLQRPNRNPENEWYGEVTWCEDKQNDDDTCYIKASAKTTDLADEITRLRAERDAIWNEAIEAAAKHIESDTHNYAICIRRLKK